MYTLHYWPDSASQVLRMVLRLTDATFREVQIDRAGGALDSAAYRALQPLGKIPALETPDGPVFETAAILLYLADRHPGLAPAPDAKDRGAFLSWLAFSAFNLHAPVLQVFYPERTASDTSEVTANAAAQIKANFAVLDAMIGRTRPDWLSTRPGVMNLYLGMMVHWLGGFAEGHPARLTPADLPNLGPILVALESHPAVAEVAAAEGLKPTFFTDPY